MAKPWRGKICFTDTLVRQKLCEAKSQDWFLIFGGGFKKKKWMKSSRSGPHPSTLLDWKNKINPHERMNERILRKIFQYILNIFLDYNNFSDPPFTTWCVVRINEHVSLNSKPLYLGQILMDWALFFANIHIFWGFCNKKCRKGGIA